jgi:hypothetical protein
VKDEIERALAPLIGRPVWAAGRAGAMLWLHLGERRVRTANSSGSGDLAEYALHVSCPWRLIGREGIYTASGDYFTPADPDGDPADFDWDEPGASWCDLRLRGFIAETAKSPQPVTGVSADDLGSLRLTLGDDFVLDVFPDSSHTDHVESEFWRLLQPASGGPHFVVGSEGLDRVVET